MIFCSVLRHRCAWSCQRATLHTKQEQLTSVTKFAHEDEHDGISANETRKHAVCPNWSPLGHLPPAGTIQPRGWAQHRLLTS